VCLNKQRKAAVLTLASMRSSPPCWKTPFLWINRSPGPGRELPCCERRSTMRVPLPSDGYRTNEGQGPKGPLLPMALHRFTDPHRPNESRDPPRSGSAGNQRPAPQARQPVNGRLFRWLPLLIIGLLLWQVASWLTAGNSSGACTLSYGTFYQVLQVG